MMMTEQQYEVAADSLTLAVWEIWTSNGNGMDFDKREQTIKSARDAVTNTYQDGITIDAWQAEALRCLNGA